MEEVQGKLFPLQHISTYPERRQHGVAEEVYASEWARQNAIEPWLNHGQCLLELILSRPGKTWGDLTQRDAQVAASVVQWLGTNCGLGFIKECERKIEIAKVKQAQEEKENWEAERVAKRLMQAP